MKSEISLKNKGFRYLLWTIFGVIFLSLSVFATTIITENKINTTGSGIFGSLDAPNCDVKSYTNGTIYCGTDATIGGGAISGLGSIGFIPLWNNTNELNNSILQQNGLTLTTIGIINATNLRVNDTNVFLISQFNTTNTSYRTLSNITFVGNITTTATGDFCITSGLCLSGVSGGDNVSWNQTYATSNLYFTKAQWNVTNATYRTIDNMTFPIGFFNATHIPIFTINATHILVSAINSSHLSAGTINATHLMNLINVSHIPANTINATHIGVGAVNTTGILDNTILPIDLGSAVNDTYVRNNTAYNTTLINVTQIYTFAIAGACPTTTSGSFCRNTTGTFIVG